MSEPLDNGRITFTVKELLAKVDAKLDLIVAQLDSKAERHEFENLEQRVLRLEGSAATDAQLNEYRAKQEQERKRDRRWLLGFGTTTVLAVLGLLATAVLSLVQ